MTRPILYDYSRSSAAYRVRIALNLKGVDYESRAGRLARGRAEVGRVSRAQSAGAGADAGDRRAPADPEPGDHQLSRPSLRQPAADPRLGRGRARPRRRHGDDGCLRHPPAQQSARAQISQERARPFAGRGRSPGTCTGSREGLPALEAMAAPQRGQVPVRRCADRGRRLPDPAALQCAAVQRAARCVSDLAARRRECQPARSASPQRIPTDSEVPA